MSNFDPMFTNGLDGFMRAVPMGVYAYMGAICLATAGAECKKPKDLGRALMWSGVVFVALYGVCQFVATGIVPNTEVNLDTAIFTVAAEKIFGPMGGTVLNVAAWLAAATCLLMGSFYTSSRVLYQLAKSKGLPKKFTYLGEKSGTPIFGIVVTWILVAIFTIVAYYAPNQVYVALTNQNVIVWTVAWGLALVCSFILRKDHKKLIQESGWKQPLFPLFPILGIVGCAYTVYLAIAEGVIHLLITVAWIALVAVYYFGFARKYYEGVLTDDDDEAAKKLKQLSKED